MDKIEDLAWTWLEANWKIKKEDMPNLICYPYLCMSHIVVEFYDNETDKKYHEWFLTSDMVKELVDGKNPKKIRNQYKK